MLSCGLLPYSGKGVAMFRGILPSCMKENDPVCGGKGEDLERKEAKAIVSSVLSCAYG